MDRYQLLASAFVDLADTLTADYDVAELSQQLIDYAVSLLPVDAAGIVLADGGCPRVLASSSEEARMLELLQLHADAGPCLHVYRTGEPMLVDDLHTGPERWPAFAIRADEHGFRSVLALPMRLRDERIGTLNLFSRSPGPMSAGDVAIAQALADIATIGILHQREISHSVELMAQLQTALKTRLVIEQAKGVLAERGNVDMDEAFSSLRAYARNTRRALSDLARAVVHGGDEADAVLRSRRT
ncbi:GAF and ANTAR domain-containing protein [Mycobacterium antarcticum]|uniref:GAF and ANTAR domain-containing protein n=1 Tax=Mycolicibacterium sp. TUM20984 TaxID=3023368 RepID=UPI00239F3EFC|nr:GAF and ANTAR domain-containing protein [Mycolicibacterium sp. TUM20984]GLP80903.1 transcriptional regulator [Mycolicibacterium sp. TUM20984]